MSNDKGGTSAHEGVHTVLHQLLGAGINGGSCLIQNEHRRIGHRRPGNGQQLALTLGQVGAVAGQHGIIPVGQAADKAVCIGQLCRRDALLVSGIQIAVADVVHHRTGKQMGILEHDAQGTAQVRLFDLIDIDAVVADLAIGNVIKTVDQVGDGGLAGTGSAYEGDLLPRLGPQADVVEYDLIRRISEVHIVKDHASLQLGVSNGAVRLVGMPPGPHVGALGTLAS